MLAVGFIPRLDQAKKTRHVSDGSGGGDLTSGIGRRAPRGSPHSTVANATAIVWVAPSVG